MFHSGTPSCTISTRTLVRPCYSRFIIVAPVAVRVSSGPGSFQRSAVCLVSPLRARVCSLAGRKLRARSKAPTLNAVLGLPCLSNLLGVLLEQREQASSTQHPRRQGQQAGAASSQGRSADAPLPEGPIFQPASQAASRIDYKNLPIVESIKPVDRDSLMVPSRLIFGLSGKPRPVMGELIVARTFRELAAESFRLQFRSRTINNEKFGWVVIVATC